MRTKKSNPKYDHLYIDCVPPIIKTTALGLSDRVIYECKRALQIYEDLCALDLKNPDGTSYTMVILTPYVKALEYLLVERKTIRVTNDLLIGTVDSIQGREFNVVILTTCREHCGDLNRCRLRGNVATSRAKDILVIILSEKFAKACRCKERRLRFWNTPRTTSSTDVNTGAR